MMVVHFRVRRKALNKKSLQRSLLKELFIQLRIVKICNTLDEENFQKPPMKKSSPIEYEDTDRRE